MHLNRITKLKFSKTYSKVDKTSWKTNTLHRNERLWPNDITALTAQLGTQIRHSAHLVAEYSIDNIKNSFVFNHFPSTMKRTYVKAIHKLSIYFFNFKENVHKLLKTILNSKHLPVNCQNRF